MWVSLVILPVKKKRPGLNDKKHSDVEHFLSRPDRDRLSHLAAHYHSIKNNT
jgi:hypothetical protein